MQILLDANIVGRFLDISDPLFPIARATIDRLARKGHKLVYTPQVEIELSSFMTRPKNVNGFGLNSREIEVILDELERTFTLLTTDESILRDEFRKLRRETAAIGKHVHDIRHVAACRTLNVPCIVTWNFRDFATAESLGYIRVLQPNDVLADKYQDC